MEQADRNENGASRSVSSSGNPTTVRREADVDASSEYGRDTQLKLVLLGYRSFGIVQSTIL